MDSWRSVRLTLQDPLFILFITIVIYDCAFFNTYRLTKTSLTAIMFSQNFALFCMTRYYVYIV